MKKIVAALDSFKGSLSSLEAGEAVAKGVRRVYPDAEVHVLPLADGGEGTVDALVCGCGGVYASARVCDPLGRPVDARYGILPGNIAVIEMAAAAGLTLLSESERDPKKTTTYGVGELIRDALMRGCRQFILGIGGSATNDGGVGMLQALGLAFLDDEGRQIPRGAEGLNGLYEIRLDGALPELASCSFSVACDVTNPLCGENGCSAVYAPQKGATPEDVKYMDVLLADYAKLTQQVLPNADPEYAGAGAAGGMGFACMSYLGAKLKSGITLVLDALHAKELFADADLVITGEGRLDGQTAMGKAPVGVARLAKQSGKPVVALAGCVTDAARAVNAEGIDAFFPIVPAAMPLERAMKPSVATQNLANTAEQVLLLIKTFCDK
ncbi:MAG: glycerate kinase [Clostridia bacterium]|nr:glycerate kinase [Clostridia bacterium]